MIVKVKIPKVSANVEEETVTSWLKREGDRVRKGEALAEITTEKACFELESPRSGIVRRILAKEKSILPVGYVIAFIGGAADPLPDVTESNRKILDKHRRSVGKKLSRVRDRKAARRIVRATPAARRLARELGVDLANVGRDAEVEIITESIVRSYLTA